MFCFPDVDFIISEREGPGGPFSDFVRLAGMPLRRMYMFILGD